MERDPLDGAMERARGAEVAVHDFLNAESLAKAKAIAACRATYISSPRQAVVEDVSRGEAPSGAVGGRARASTATMGGTR